MFIIVLDLKSFIEKEFLFKTYLTNRIHLELKFLNRKNTN